MSLPKGSKVPANYNLATPIIVKSIEETIIGILNMSEKFELATSSLM